MADDAKIVRGPADLDETDRAILQVMSSNARISNAALAEAVGVAPSTAHTRLRALVDSGVIRQFTTEVAPAALGLGIQALVAVNIRVGARHAINDFLEDMKKLPQVVQVFFLGGSEDFIVHVAVRDADDVRSFVVDHLSANRFVASTRTSFVFDHHATPVATRARRR